jgi:hypothetical protein
LTHNIPDRQSERRQVAWLASEALLLLISGITLLAQVPPAPLPADAPARDFSAARAMRHVEAIAEEPHPMGSPAAGKVRAYLSGELEALGLRVEAQEPQGEARNILARWRGTGPATKMALLLSAHYDSVERGPGAGDDASGVAAILEALRALKAGPPLARDLIVLFNDGEEAGLYGAAAFADHHRWAKEVGVVLNLDARGNSGPSYMFETSERNGWLIEQVARALPRPITTSLTMEVYRLMPNDTDLTVYKARGMAGLNFAFIGGLSYYHSPDDTAANLDRRTLQDQGANVLAMARHLGQLDLDDPWRPNVVYFSVLSQFVVVYPMTWVIPLLVCAALAYPLVTALGVMRGRVRLVEVILGCGLFLAVALAAALLIGALRLMAAGIFANFGLGALWTRSDMAILAIFSATALVLAGAAFVAAGRRWSLEGMGLGVLFWWLAAAVATSLALPGASYAFVWPLLAILAGEAVSLFVRRGGGIALAASWLGAIPLLVIQLTILPGIMSALNVPMSGPLMVPVVLVGAALLPLAGQVLVERAGRH